MIPRSLAAAAAILLIIGLSACASVTTGRSFPIEGIVKLQPGKTTLAEAKQLLGEPESYSNVSGVGQVLIWQYIHSEATPFSSETTSRSASIVFDQADVMVKVQSLYNIELPAADRKRLLASQ